MEVKGGKMKENKRMSETAMCRPRRYCEKGGKVQ